MIYLFIGVGIFIGWLLYNTIYDCYTIMARNFPSGPLTLPLIGGLYSLDPKKPHLSVQKMVKKYGKILSIRMGPMGRMVFVQDMAVIDKVFENTEFNDRPNMPIFDVLNQGADGIGSSKYDQRWKKIHKVFHSGLAKITMKQLEHTALGPFHQLMERFLQKAQPGAQFNPRDDLLKAYSAIFSSLVYGIEPESLDSEDLQSRMKYHDTLMKLIHPMHPMNIFAFLWKLMTPMKKTLLKCLKEKDNLFNKSFDKHFDMFDGSLRDLIDIIAEFELSKQNSDEVDAVTKSIRKKDMFQSAWTLYLAGCDTTTTVTQWLMLFLSVNPEIQEKIQDEVDQLNEPDIEGTLEQKEELNYTRATILEALRCSSTVGVGLPRESCKDQTLGGYDIPEGTTIMLNQWYIHHDPELWPEPFVFKPERFLDDNGKLFSNYHIFKKMPFIPFSRGKRNCIGKEVALDLALVFVVELMKQTTIKLPRDFEPDFLGENKMVLQPRPFPIECKRRQKPTTL